MLSRVEVEMYPGRGISIPGFEATIGAASVDNGDFSRACRSDGSGADGCNVANVAACVDVATVAAIVPGTKFALSVVESLSRFVPAYGLNCVLVTSFDETVTLVAPLPSVAGEAVSSRGKAVGLYVVFA